MVHAYQGIPRAVVIIFAVSYAGTSTAAALDTTAAHGGSGTFGFTVGVFGAALGGRAAGVTPTLAAGVTPASGAGAAATRIEGSWVRRQLCGGRGGYCRCGGQERK